MLTPSSNSVVEPWCSKMINSIDNTTDHFGRVEVLFINLLKLLVREDINIENISYKRNALNNIVATYLQENTVKNTSKVINGVLKILEKEK